MKKDWAFDEPFMADKLREEGAAYAIGDRRVRALIPRNEAHRDACKFYRGLIVARRKKYGGFVPRGLCTKMFDDDYEQQSDDNVGIKYFVSLRTKPEHRHVLRNLFATQQTINEMANSHTCQFSFIPIEQPNVPWDLCAFTFGSARDLIRQWTPFMQKLFDILNAVTVKPAIIKNLSKLALKPGL
uniref:Uncharacterized protein n=1 Tax=Globodera rostochiensis TaxID=31243 RepID=A0A914GYV2_GLORO